MKLFFARILKEISKECIELFTYTFNEIYQNIIKQESEYEGNKNLQKRELLKVPNIKIKAKTEFTEIENKSFLFSNGDSYHIEKALQTIQFELDRTGGKIKSEAGMINDITKFQ